MLRLVTVSFLLLVSSSAYAGNAHDVRFNVPQVAIPMVSLPEIEAVGEWDFRPMQHDLLAPTPRDYSQFQCGTLFMPTVSHGSIVPVAQLKGVETSSMALASMLGRPGAQQIHFKLIEKVTSYTTYPDGLGYMHLREASKSSY